MDTEQLTPPTIDISNRTFNTIGITCSKTCSICSGGIVYGLMYLAKCPISKAVIGFSDLLGDDIIWGGTSHKHILHMSILFFKSKSYMCCWYTLLVAHLRLFIHGAVENTPGQMGKKLHVHLWTSPARNARASLNWVLTAMARRCPIKGSCCRQFAGVTIIIELHWIWIFQSERFLDLTGWSYVMDSLYNYGICEFYFCAVAVWQPCILCPHENSRWSMLVYVGLGILMARPEMSCCSS